MNLLGPLPDLPKRLDVLEGDMHEMLEVMQNIDTTLTQLLTEVQSNNARL